MAKVRGVEYGLFNWGRPDRPCLDYDWAARFVLDEAVAHACPFPKKVAAEFGAEWTLERYASCDEVMLKMILEPAREHNPILFRQLISPTPRIMGEPVGKFEEDAVPESHINEMSPGSTVWGYAISRVIIEALGRDENRRLAIKNEVLPDVANMIYSAIVNSWTPAELLALLTDGAVKNGADVDKVLGHIFVAGKIEEENCHMQHRMIKASLQWHMPAVWERYSTMTLTMLPNSGYQR